MMSKPADFQAKQNSPSLAALVIVVLAVFLLIVAAGLFVPVYSDEAATKMMRGMFFANGWKYNTLLPQCNRDYLRSVPALLYPGAFAYDLIYGRATPLGIRLLGMATDLCWLALTAGAIRVLTKPKHLHWALLAAVTSVCGLGVLPLTLVMARGEQVMLFLLMLFLCLPVLTARIAASTSRARVLACAIPFCLVVSVFFYTHPKTLFFFPVVLTSCVLCFWRHSRALTLVVAGFVLATVWQSLVFAGALTKCADAPMFSSQWLSLMTPTGLLLSDPLGFLNALWVNVRTAPGAIVDQLIFADQYQSAWLAASPGVAAMPLIAWINPLIRAVIIATFGVAAILPPLGFALKLLQRRLDGAACCMAALWLGLFGHMALYRSWNFYTGTLTVPLAALLAVSTLAALGSPMPARIVKGITIAALLSLSLLFLVSAALLLSKVMPPTIENQRTAQIGLPGQPLSIPALGYGRERSQIREFAAQCHVEGDAARHLVIDNLTFFAFDGLREPLQSDYVNDQAFGVDYPGEATIKLLKEAGARDVVAQCGLLSPTLLAHAHREGNLCCLHLE
ncbi:hypothetical protein [Paraburkholderia bryophila]|uniref:4-amino-4-deoxy-L-arabinose transferase-like glycosyltransferase n=1 Tax=Paraburkholderia bryophila TaxID=420952 RepID=A0A7Y9WFG6_9BURK|nr:hypothetical protein [Paraburkholderia bryophila]NYH19856.1 hypothetical protein [Paraburkholderia bryophila]